MRYWALVPARGGSKGIPKKNIKVINGLPLIAHTINCAFSSKIFEDVYVSTDSEEIASVANQFNAKVPFLRNSFDSSDKAHMFGVYKNFLLGMQEKGHKLPDVLCILLPTNPLRTKEDIIKVLASYDENPEITWAFSCNEMEHHPYRAVRISPEGLLQPFFPLKNNVMWSNRQELPKAYRFNGAIISGKVKSILNNDEYPIDSFEYMDTYVGAVKTSQYSGVDVDTLLDLEYAEFLMERINSES